MTTLDEFLELSEAYYLTSPPATGEDARRLRVHALETLVSLTADAVVGDDPLELRWHAQIQLRLLYELGMADRRHLELASRDGSDIRALEAARVALRERTAPATAAVRAQGDRHRLRATELRGTGLSARQIGVRMGLEEGREPYGRDQVFKWLRTKR